jgi:hypothetical protein
MGSGRAGDAWLRSEKSFLASPRVKSTGLFELWLRQIELAFHAAVQQ